MPDLVPPAQLGNKFESWLLTYYSLRWLVESVRLALDQHEAGSFANSASLMIKLFSDSRVNSASGLRASTATRFPLQVRAAVDGGLGQGVRPGSARARSDAALSDVQSMFEPQGRVLSMSTRRWLREVSTLMGFAVAQICWQRSAERWVPYVEPWPAGAITHDPQRWIEMIGGNIQGDSMPGLIASTKTGEVPIVHGDGRWIVEAPRGPHSHLLGAIRCIAMPWVRGEMGERGAAQEAQNHTNRSPIGTTPDGVSLESQEAAKFEEMIKGILTGRQGGMKPAGYSLELLDLGSNDGARLLEGVINRMNASIVVALLGNDVAIRTDTSGTYINEKRMEVADHLTLSDIRDEDRTWQTGLVYPYVAYNYGPDVVPIIETELPQNLLGNAASLEADQRQRHTAQLAADRAACIVVDQEHSDDLAMVLNLRKPWPRIDASAHPQSLPG